jgi:Ca2+-transporting ATPase
MEKGEPDIMKRPPRPTKEPVVNKEMLTGLIIVPIVDTIAILSVFAVGLARYPDHVQLAQTMAFVTLCVSELFRAYTARSEHFSVFSIGFFSNQSMQWAVGSSLFLVLITVYVPFLTPFFDTVPLGLNDWLTVIPFALMAPVAAEIVKVFLRKGAR